MKVSVFVPAHITGFFSIYENKNPLKKGSCGGGILIDKGVTTTIEILEKSVKQENSIDIKINGKKDPKNETISLKTIELMKEKFPSIKKFENSNENNENENNENENNNHHNEQNEHNTNYLSISHDIDVPVGAGFGTSASCGLGTAIGLFKLLDLPISLTEAHQFAHMAEISLGSGLGDVISQTAKGIVIRKIPGAPGIGETINIANSKGENRKNDFSNVYVLTKTLGQIDTSSIIKDPIHKKNINDIGIAMQEKIISNPTLENFMDLSYEFAKDTKLINSELLNIVDNLKQFTIGASMAMLGNTVFTIIKKEDIDKIDNLDEFIISKIYTDGIKSTLIK